MLYKHKDIRNNKKMFITWQVMYIMVNLLEANDVDLLHSLQKSNARVEVLSWG